MQYFMCLIRLFLSLKDSQDLDEEELDELELRKMALQSTLSLAEKSSSPTTGRISLPAGRSERGAMQPRRMSNALRRNESMENRHLHFLYQLLLQSNFSNIFTGC